MDSRWVSARHKLVISHVGYMGKSGENLISHVKKTTHHRGLVERRVFVWAVGAGELAVKIRLIAWYAFSLPRGV